MSITFNTKFIEFSKTTGGGGTEMLADPGFDNGYTNWADYYGITIGSSQLTYDGIGAYVYVAQYSDNGFTDLAINTTYKLQFTIVSSSPGMSIKFATYSQTITYIDYNNYTTGTYNLEFTTPGSFPDENGFSIRIRSQDAVGGTIQNVSIIKK